MHMHMDTYTYIHIHIHIHICLRIHTHTHMYAHTRIHTMHTYTYIHIYAHTHTHTYTCTHARMHTHYPVLLALPVDPANPNLTENIIKITDFGLAFKIKQVCAEHGNVDTHNPWTAPEVITKKEFCKKSDVWR